VSAVASAGVRELNAVEREAFQVARLVGLHQMPYYATGLFSLLPVALPGLGTFAVDPHWRLYMDPARLVGPDAWSPREAGGVLLHELGHLLRVHAERAKGLPQPYRHDPWNIAGDAEINDDLFDAGVDLPEGVVTPQAIDCDPHGVAEDYYTKLIEDDDASRGGGTGDSDGAASGGAGGADEPGCGSGAGAKPVPGELAPSQPVDGHRGVDEATGGMIRRRVAEAVREAAGNGRGTVPAGLRRWAEGVLTPPKVPWQRVLGAALRRAVADAAGQTDYTYRRPSRRQSPGIIFPAMRGPKIHVAIVLDTSGSMSKADLLAALSEVRGVLRAAGVKLVTIITCDAATGTPQQITRVEQVVLTGGGGTDMRIGIAAADDLRPAPHVTVTVSDGDTPWPTVAPRVRQVFVIVGNDEAATRTPRFGHTVTVPSGAGG
jgi:predicted metal-dependent peptidase